MHENEIKNMMLSMEDINNLPEPTIKSIVKDIYYLANHPSYKKYPDIKLNLIKDYIFNYME